MRTLVIAGEYPWPEDSGSRIRLAMVLRGLRRCGPVELFSIVPRFRTDVDPPDRSLGLARVGRVGFDNRPPRGVAAAPRCSGPCAAPRAALAGRPAAERALVRSCPAPTTWSGSSALGPGCWRRTVSPRPSSTSTTSRTRRSRPVCALPPGRPAGGHGLRAPGAHAPSAREMRRWRRLHRRADGGSAPRRVQPPRRRPGPAAGVSRVRSSPTATDRSTDRSAGWLSGSPPTVLFQGLLRYPPNIEAARFLVREVVPALRALVPDVRVRLVGDAAPAVTALDDPPRVTVVGQVPDIDAELAGADLVVVPVRYGSGTRHQDPRGLRPPHPGGLDDGRRRGPRRHGRRPPAHRRHAEDLAAACARLLGGRGLRAASDRNAHRLYLYRYRGRRVDGS